MIEESWIVAPLPNIKPDQPDQMGGKLMRNQDENNAPSEIGKQEDEVVFRNIWDRLSTPL